MYNSTALTGSGRAVERGETYGHVEYGPVEVIGIWKGVENVDSAHPTDENDMTVVRYSTVQPGERVAELTDTLTEFLDAIE